MATSSPPLRSGREVLHWECLVGVPTAIEKRKRRRRTRRVGGGGGEEEEEEVKIIIYAKPKSMLKSSLRLPTLVLCKPTESWTLGPMGFPLGLLVPGTPSAAGQFRRVKLSKMIHNLYFTAGHDLLATP
jgi:hypothetical protein